MGAAGFIVRHMIALAKEKYQADEITAACFSRNTAGLLLYPKLGFVPYAIEERQDWQNRRTAIIQMHFVES